MQERKYPLKRQDDDERDLKLTIIDTSKLPSKVDFRPYCPDIYDQKSLGSCTSNAYIFLFRMLMQAQGNNVNIDYSRLKHYYDERVLEGSVNEDSGAQMRTGAKVLKNTGACLEELWKYIQVNFAVQPSAQAIEDSAKHKITAYKNLNNSNEIKYYLAQQDSINKPMGVAIGIDIYESFETNEVARTGIVPIPNKDKEQYLGGHAVAIVGYDDNFGKSNKMGRGLSKLMKALFGSSDDEGYFIVRNSWGKWGDNGYFYLPYSFMKKHAYDFWVIE